MGTFRPQTEAQMSHAELGTENTRETGKITKPDVVAALNNWGKGLVHIATTYANKGDYVGAAKTAISAAYAYDQGEVLFKPTLASKFMFRNTFDSALSYFVGGNPNYSEDNGFALNPWVKAEFDLAGIIVGDNHAMVMGNKLLTKKDGSLTIANFTMCFTRDSAGKLKINLHHSSLPYKPA